MSARTVTAAVLAAAGLLLAGCSSGPSGQTDVDRCAKIVADYTTMREAELVPLKSGVVADYTGLSRTISAYSAALEVESAEFGDPALRAAWGRVASLGDVAATAALSGRKTATFDALTPYVRAATAAIDQCTTAIKAATTA